MISKRNLFGIIINISVLIFLFMFTVVLKEISNEYEYNDNLKKSSLNAEGEYKNNEIDLDKYRGNYVLFVGDKNSMIAKSISEWTLYTKKNIAYLDNIIPFDEAINIPELIIFENEYQMLDDNLEIIKELANKGAIIILGNIKNPKNISINKELKEFLGVRRVVNNKVDLDSIKLFKGLLLGKETIFLKDNKLIKDESKIDLDFEIPYYIVSKGTKVYMTGVIEDDDIENEEMPVIIWRAQDKNKCIYVVNGDYLNDATAFGLLNGFMAESYDYYIYPVVNAQNVSVIDFPGFANENNKIIEDKYARNLLKTNKDIIWPSLESLMVNSKFKMTCFISPEFDYTDNIYPNGEDLTFFLKVLKENKAEAALSLNYEKADSLNYKIKEDEKFFSNTNYSLGSVYYEHDKINYDLNNNSNLLKNIKTAVCDYETNKQLLTYENNVTRQSITSNANYYSYSDDLMMRSIQSALAYTNIGIDLHNIYYPLNDNDSFEKIQKEFANTLMSYFDDFKIFDKTTISKSDNRIRVFLNMNYKAIRKDNIIDVNIYNINEEAYFILKLHHEKIVNIIGGEYQLIDEDTYLIKSDKQNLKIEVVKDKLYLE